MQRAPRGQSAPASYHDMEAVRAVIDLLAKKKMTHKQAKDVLRLVIDVMESTPLCSCDDAITR